MMASFNWRLPQFNKNNIVLISTIFILSYLSGRVDFLNELAKDGLTLRETERGYVSVASAMRKEANQENKMHNADHEYFIRSVEIRQKREIAPTIAPTSIPVKSNEWGVATKIGEHTYTMQVQPDEKIASAEEILAALNNYRKQHGRSALSWDAALAAFASSRADYFVSSGTLDSHKGFLDYLNNQDGFKKLGFSSLGENSSYGFNLNGVHLIEWVYAGDEEHNSNQLSSEWNYVGIGVKGGATNLVFGGSKL